MSGQNLSLVLNQSPEIIHISCHGDMDYKKNQYFLQVEKEVGLQDQLTELCLENILDGSQPNSLKLVFVSACHSESIGRIFEKKGVPIVIAVNALSMVLDDVCVYFAQIFYSKLFSGKTPK